MIQLEINYVIKINFKVLYSLDNGINFKLSQEIFSIKTSTCEFWHLSGLQWLHYDRFYWNSSELDTRRCGAASQWMLHTSSAWNAGVELIFNVKLHSIRWTATLVKWNRNFKCNINMIVFLVHKVNIFLVNRFSILVPCITVA